MSKPIDEILRAVAPHLRAELASLGFPARSAEGDDLLQEINIRLWKALVDRDGRLEYFDSYAKKVVISVFINEMESRQKERELTRAAMVQLRQRTEGGAESKRTVNPTLENIIESLAALSTDQRRMIELRGQGFTLAEIAQLTHCSLSKVRSGYYRGLKELKPRLRRRGVLYDR